MAALIYGAICYIIFLGSFLYAIGFVGNLIVPKSIDIGGGGPFAISALIVNVILLDLFAIQHSVMARQKFKRGWTQFVPRPVERSTYVLFSSLILLLLYWQWRPMTDVIWSVTNPTAAVIVWAIFWIGWGTVLLSTFLINHYDLFGLQQVYAHWQGRAEQHPSFRTPMFYKCVRHPIYFGLLLAVYATAAAKGTLWGVAGAVLPSIGLLMKARLEERWLTVELGDAYAGYCRRVPMMFPFARRH